MNNTDQNKKNKTKFQEKKIKDFEEQIAEMKKEGVNEMKVNRGSRAPIILFDEAEKVKSQSVIDAMGKILDPKVNWSHYDKFFEGKVDLSECLIFCTMNWKDRAPDFIKDRCKFVDIELLTYGQRIEILETKATEMAREFFPDESEKVDEENAKKIDKHNPVGILTPNQQRVRQMIGPNTIKACITESWGIRGGLWT